MWCYRKPGFEALLAAELQRQQQRSQFCDILLEADGVSVPAHSCVLSAISPHVSSALSSAPAPPAEQSRLLEFQGLGPCALIRMAQLLYSGEMAGEGEREKQEAISAAAKLGIHGLVEVTSKGDHRGSDEGGEEGGRCHAEVGVQTEPESEGRRSRWRREVRDGSTFLWKEAPSGGERDTWTQTEEVPVNTSPPAQNDPLVIHPEIPYIPVSVVYAPENYAGQPPCVPTVSVQESTSTSVPTPVQNFSTDPNSWWVVPEAAAPDVPEVEQRWEDEQIEHFHDNIPGFIDYFLDPEREGGQRRGRGRRARAAGARRAGKRAKMQTVDVQDVGVSVLQKQFLHRWGARTASTGQGGGAVGRKLYLKSRELLKKAEAAQRKRRRRCKSFGFDGYSELLPYYGDGRSGAQDITSVREHHRPRQEPAAVSSTPVRIYSSHTSSSPSVLLSPAGPGLPPASALLHTTRLPSPAPLPQEEQPEQIDRLLEEVMMGLDILPNSSSSSSVQQQQRPAKNGSSTRTYDSSRNESSRTTRQSRTTGLVIAGPGPRGSTQVVERGARGRDKELVQQQQQGDGELNTMLDHFLQNFERHMDSCGVREQADGRASKASRKASVRRKRKTTVQAAPPAAIHSQAREACAGGGVSPKHAQESSEKVKTTKSKRGRKQAASGAETKAVQDGGDKQLQQMPVVRLKRSSLRGHSGPGDKNSTETGVSSAEIDSCDGDRRTYSLRSRHKEAPSPVNLPFLHEPLPMNRHRRQPLNPSAKTNGKPPASPDVQKSPKHERPFGPNEPPGEGGGRAEEDSSQPQGKAQEVTKSGTKRRAKTENRSTKRVCSDPIGSENAERPGAVAKHVSAQAEEVIDVETVSLTSAGGFAGEGNKGVKPEEIWENPTDGEAESSDVEVVDVDGDADGVPDPTKHAFERREQEDGGRCQRRPSPLFPSLSSMNEGSVGSEESGDDEDVDVTGSSSPPLGQGPLVITCMQASGEDEEEDVDVM